MKLVGRLILSSFVLFEECDAATGDCMGLFKIIALMRFRKGVNGLSSTLRSKKENRVDDASGSGSEVFLAEPSLSTLCRFVFGFGFCF